MIETGKTDEAIDAKTGWPERYYAVIFTAQHSLTGDDIYEITANRMVTLAQQQPGFLGLNWFVVMMGLASLFPIGLIVMRLRNGAVMPNMWLPKRWDGRNFTIGTGYALLRLCRSAPSCRII